MTMKFSKADRHAIAKTLALHGISIKKDEFNSLVDFVEQRIEGYLDSKIFFDEATKKRTLEISRAQLNREIERLRVSLEELSLSSSYILHIASAREPELTSLLSNIAKDDKELPLTMVCVVMRSIRYACGSILSGRDKYAPAIVAGNGRPQDRHKQTLVRKLAIAFERCTGRKATYTESGPFDDFLSACLEACNLKEGAGSNRKLIRAALHGPTGHVPKPRKTK